MHYTYIDVYMNGCTERWMYGCTNVQTCRILDVHLRIYLSIHVYMHKSTNACMYECTNVRMYDSVECSNIYDFGIENVNILYVRDCARIDRTGVNFDDEQARFRNLGQD